MGRRLFLFLSFWWWCFFSSTSRTLARVRSSNSGDGSCWARIRSGRTGTPGQSMNLPCLSHSAPKALNPGMWRGNGVRVMQGNGLESLLNKGQSALRESQEPGPEILRNVQEVLLFCCRTFSLLL